MSAPICTCVGCGCTDDRACRHGCFWLRVDRIERKGVCSSCSKHTASWDATHRPHEFDDDCVCTVCGHDGAEANHYSKRGYAHEYEGTRYCRGPAQ